MSIWLNNALYGWYPYVALSVFLLGCLLRFDHSQYTWRTGSSQLLRRRQLIWGSNLFHVGILAIFAGHFVGLLTPGGGVRIAFGVSHTFKLAPRHDLRRLIAGNWHCWIGIAILLALWVQLTLGLLTIPLSAQHLDGHEMVKFMGWAQGILTLHPGAAALIADVSPIFKCHLFLRMTIFQVFPFTRLVHVWSAPVWYLGRSAYQVVRTTRPVVRRATQPIQTPPVATAVRPIDTRATQPALGDD